MRIRSNRIDGGRGYGDGHARAAHFIPKGGSHLETQAEARGIPVIDQYGYILRQGGRIEDAHWPHDRHWSPTGHRWAAEALFEWIERHQDVCNMQQPSHPATDDSAMIRPVHAREVDSRHLHRW